MSRSIALDYHSYHAWANDKILTSLEPVSREDLYRDLGSSHGGIWGTLEHTYQADEIWLARLRGYGNARLDHFRAPVELHAFREQWAQLHRQYLELIEGFSDMDLKRSITYRLMSGDEWSSPVFENLLHVVNHGTYHRGQVITMQRQIGAAPVSTDFVRWVRTVKVAS